MLKILRSRGSMIEQQEVERIKLEHIPEEKMRVMDLVSCIAAPISDYEFF